MNNKTDTGFFTFPQWEGIPSLVHGFGKRGWTGACFDKIKEFRNLKRIFLKQIHSNRFHVITKIPRTPPEGDALLTDKPGILLVIKTADCLPVLILDKDNRAVAAVHCGWRGTSQRIIQHVVAGMERCFGSRPENLWVGLGPHIRSTCYEVGAELPVAFEHAGLPLNVFTRLAGKPGKFLLDLKKANFLQLMDTGVKEAHIVFNDICTHCQPDLASFRRDKKKAGRMLNFIGFNKMI
ncbi:MAG: peptidoglycan editing factor PgeF [Candidatus Aminicenantes bacterium]|nr:peptidoglycan editing factor PgeF [Candidatus Aminicenantes bacterium]